MSRSPNNHENMAKFITANDTKKRKTTLHHALEEVKMIRVGKLPYKSARELLKRSRKSSDK